MYVASVISHCDSDTADLGEVKVLIIHVVIRSDPANPNTRRLLPSKDPHRVVILKTGWGGGKKKSYYFIICWLHENLKPSFKLTKSQVIICVTVANNNVNLTVVVFWMISGSSLSSGTTSSTKRGTVGGAGGGARGVMAAFLALEKNLLSTEDK